MSNNLYNIILDFIFVGGITLNLFILLLLFRKKYKELHGVVLIFIFITTLLSMLFGYAFLHRIKWLMICCWMIIQSAAWYLGPLLYLYIQSLYMPVKGLVRKNFLHFLPAILFMIFVSFPSLESIFELESLFEYVANIMEQKSVVVEVAQILFLGFYCILALRELFYAKHLIKKIYANLEGLGIQWLFILLSGLLAVCLIDLFTSFYELWVMEFSFASGYLTISALAILISYLAYNGLTQSRILLPDFLWTNGANIEKPNDIILIENDSTEVQQKTLISNNELVDLSQKLKEVIDQQKLYKDQTLTLGILASRMDVSQRKLSTFLNQNLKSTFFELINKKRVEEVKLMIDSDDYKHYTLLAIGLEAGFSSKTSFYRTFKKITGMSPSEYKNAQLP